MTNKLDANSRTNQLQPPSIYFKNIEVDSASPNVELESRTLRNVFSGMDLLMDIPTVRTGAVMPDACPTGPDTIPVGGVVVAEDAIHPGFHSADICCSVMATTLTSDIDPKVVLDTAMSVTHFGSGGRKRSSGVFKHLDESLADRIRANRFFSDADLKKAKLHLGTQGDGNHFLFIGRSESTGKITIITHHGSRGFGASLYNKGIQIAETYRDQLSPETSLENAWIPASSDDGTKYWEALQIVRDWTKLNHQVIHRMTANQIGLDRCTQDSFDEHSFWNEHNFVFRQKSDGPDSPDLFYHGKGATPLDDEFVPDSNNGLRLIPLNMGQPILLVRGQTTPTNLGFAPHGAGRNQSRSDHKKSRRSEGASDEMIFNEETKDLDVRFFSNKIDISELPSAYKDADEVQRQMSKFGLGEVVDRIQPYGCIMAGRT